MSPLRDFTMTHSHFPVISSSVLPSKSDIQQETHITPIIHSARSSALSLAQKNSETPDSCCSRSRNRSQVSRQIYSESSDRSNAICEEKKYDLDCPKNLNDTTDMASSGSSLPRVDRNSVTTEIPAHQRWRVFIHRHEVPRKALHVSIGILTIYLYVSEIQKTQITPWLIRALIPIAATDYIRLNYEPFNRIYIRILGIMMRESEHRCFNGVIWYLIGAWFVLAAFPKDIGVMGILLLSWCDTAASTIGRAFGKHTPRIRKGKSLAGSTAAFVVGIATASVFWGWLAPRTGPFPGDENFPFMFKGVIRLPATVRNYLGLTETQTTVRGGLALSIMSLWTGFIASTSEAANVFGFDDNLTIPALTGIGMWGFLKVFG